MKCLRVVFLFAAACVPLLAQQKPNEPRVVKLASPLPVSAQGKAAEAVDIVLTAVLSPATGATAEQWQVIVGIGGETDPPPKTFAPNAADDLTQYLVSLAEPKARTRHTDRVNISDSTMVMRVPAATPYSLVQSLVASTARAGIHRIEFGVVPAADAAEQRLRVPLPTDKGQPVKVDDPKTVLEEIRVAIYWDAANNTVIRQFGKNTIRDDAQLRGLMRDVHESLVKVGKAETPVIVDAAAGVPWQAVVGVIDACHAAGAAVEFAAPSPKKK